MKRRRKKRWGAAVIVLLGAAAVALFVRHRHQHHVALDEASDDTPERIVDRWRGFEAGRDVPAPTVDAGGLPRRPDPTSKDVTPDQVDSAMTTWRQGILEKRTDQVLTLDRAFSLLPGRYGPALVKLAETDSDERVRAFSVRVLGKMKNVALVEDFQRMLTDKSPFVRQNAAWALGQLATRPGGKEAAEVAFDDLRQAEDDPATEVRSAATNALRELQ